MKERTTSNPRQPSKQPAKAPAGADQPQSTQIEHEPTKHPAKVTVPDLKLSV